MLQNLFVEVVEGKSISNPEVHFDVDVVATGLRDIQLFLLLVQLAQTLDKDLLEFLGRVLVGEADNAVMHLGEILVDAEQALVLESARFWISQSF